MQLENNEPETQCQQKLVINGVPHAADEDVSQTVKLWLQKLGIPTEGAKIQVARRMFGEKHSLNPIAGTSTGATNGGLLTED